MTAFSESPADFWIQQASRHQQHVRDATPHVAAPAARVPLSEPSFAARPLTVPALDRHREGRRQAAEPVRGIAGEVCVRLCDGAFFPTSSAGGALDGQEACNSLCPGAPTRVYRLQPGRDGIAGAVSERTGEPYENLPVAYRFLHERDATCTCHLPQYSPVRMEAFYQDRSLKPGDSVMSPHGIRVFRGSGHFPWRASDFVDLADARHLANGERRRLKILEEASLHPGALVTGRSAAHARHRPRYHHHGWRHRHVARR